MSISHLFGWEFRRGLCANGERCLRVFVLFIVRLFDNLARRRRCRARAFFSKTKGALRGTTRYKLYRKSPAALGVARVLRISRYVRL